MRQRLRIAGSLLLLFAGIGLRLLEPWPLKIVFDHVLANRAGGGMWSWLGLESLDRGTLLVLAALGVILLTGLRALADYGNSVGFALVSNRVLGEVRHAVFCHVQGLSLSFHTRARSGDLILRVIGDVGMLRDALVSAALPLLANLLVLVGMVVVMFWLQWRLAVLVLLTLPLFGLATLRIGGRLRQVSRTQRQREGAMAATATEAMGAIQIVQAFGLEGTFAGTFSRENQRNVRESVRATRLTAGLERTVDFLIAGATALVLWYGTRLVLDGPLTPGDLLVFLAYLKTAFRPVRDLAKYTGRMARAVAAGERIVDLLDRMPEIADRPDAVPAPRLTGGVRFENVSFAYDTGERVLKDISLEISPGQRVALVGPSGIGKSTLLSLMLRLYDPVAGRILLDGRDLREYTVASLRAQVGVVLQDNVLFAVSVRENIAYGAPTAMAEEIEAAARLANAHDFIKALPQGYETILGERGVTLSHGQRQRIAIARAAIRQAPILLLDEPTTSLDEENQRMVMEALERLAAGRTTFVITHDLSHAARADLVLYLEDGRIRERGSHAQLMSALGTYARLYRLQSAALTA
jgi:ATP-binding cassette subfamily B protein